MGRRLVLLCALLAALAWPAVAPAKATPHDVKLTMSDGVAVACTLWTPSDLAAGAKAPAVMLFHGLGGTRQTMLPFAEDLGLHGYASLGCDARGHGESGGLFGLDGPRDVQDTRELYSWLAARPEVDAAHIGALGVSLGGGAVWNAAVAGVPFKAIVPVITWTNLTTALAPQGLSKSGLVQYLAQLVPQSRWDPQLLGAASSLTVSRDMDTVAALAAPRSPAAALSSLTVPTLLVQGRRDFLFDIDQALAGYRALRGPKRLYLGLLGHAPGDSSGAAPDTLAMQGTIRAWFDRFLKNEPNGVDTGTPVELATEGGSVVKFRSVPPTRTLRLRLRGASTLASGGKVVRIARLRGGAHETFGDSTVSFRAAGAWDHVVAVLSLRPPRGNELTISAGGTVTRSTSGVRTVRIRLMNQAVFVPAGSRLVVTLGGTSVVQDPANLLYLNDVSPGSRLRVSDVRLALSLLRKPVSR